MAPKLELPSLNLRELVQLRRSITVRHGLNDLQRYIDFEAFRPKLEEICKFSSKGRPHYDEVKMFKVLILQTLYNLSDEEMEYQLSDRLSFQRFVGIGYADDIPDARTIWKFRERLGAKGTKELFELFYSKMAQQGLKCSQGKLVDATFQEAPRQKNTPQDEAHIRKVEVFNEDYRMKEEGEVLNWFEITAPAGYYSINDSIGDIMKSVKGTLLLGIILKSMLTRRASDTRKEKKASENQIKLNKGIILMVQGFTVKRALSMAGMMGMEPLSKEEMLEINSKLNKVKKRK